VTRREARTDDAWRSFDLWATFIVPLLIALPALMLWFRGYGSGATGCCSQTPVVPAAAIAPSSPAIVAPTVVPPAPAPVAAPVATPAAPTIDCASIITGVSIGFAVNRAQLTDDGKRALDQTITCLGNATFEVAGHTDSDGSAASNLRLSTARANAVVRYLVSRNVPATSLSAAGYGETQPIADNSTAGGKAKNRRITFTPK
jgi:OmpA-OmpF porin, OOP family